MPPIKVLHIIKSLGRGGAEMLLPETLAIHDKKNFEFHYIYFLPWKNQLVADLESAGGKVTCFNASNNLSLLLSFRNVAKYIRQNDIRIVHCHLPWSGVLGRIAGKLAHVKVLYTEHNKWERYHKLTYHLNKLTFGMQHMAIPCSHDVEASIRQHYKGTKPIVQTISNGVNTDRFSRKVIFERDIRQELNLRPEIKVIGIVSVFRVQKRLDKWIENAIAINKQYPDTFFIIVGDGPLREEINNKISASGSRGFIHLAGLQQEVRPYLKAMDMFMMTSEFEGLPIALLEAMSMACIPACTKAGGIPEVIEQGVNGLLVDVDKPEMLSTQILDLLNSSSERRLEMAVKARETIRQKFSITRMVEELETVYCNSIK